MRLFTLKATLGQTKRFQTFEAKNDADAIGVGALRVLTLAYPISLALRHASSN